MDPGSFLWCPEPGEVALGKTGAQEVPLALRRHLCAACRSTWWCIKAMPFWDFLVLNATTSKIWALFFSSSKNKLQLFNQYLFHHSTGVEKKKKET